MPDPNSIEDICGVLGITPTYLLMRNSKIEINILSSTAQRIGRAYEKAPQRDQVIVEHVLEPYIEDSLSDNVIQIDFGLSEQPASAGTGVYLDEESMTTIKVRAGALPKGECFGVPVAGDSMEPHYSDGDILIVSKEPVNVGEIGVFTMDGEGYVKQLGRGVLHSLNPNYVDIPLTEDVICNGKVVGVLDSDDITEQ